MAKVVHDLMLTKHHIRSGGLENPPSFIRSKLNSFVRLLRFRYFLSQNPNAQQNFMELVNHLEQDEWKKLNSKYIYHDLHCAVDVLELLFYVCFVSFVCNCFFLFRFCSATSSQMIF